MANWPDLVHDLMLLITKKLDLFEDYIAFRGVCTSWRSAANKKNFDGPSPIPWLMLAEKEGSDDREFFSLSKGLIIKYPLPEAKGRKCLSSWGWLVTIGSNGEMGLLHPFSRVQIELPNQSTTDYMYPQCANTFIHTQKAVLSASPSKTSNYAVMAIHGGCGSLEIWRPGDKRWTSIHPWGGYIDVTYYEGKFYGITREGCIFEYDVSSNTRQAKLILRVTSPFFRSVRKYILESAGALLAVCREGTEDYRPVNSDDYDDDDFQCMPEIEMTYGLSRFRVVELDLINKKWKEVRSIGDRALFLGGSASTSIDTSVFPKLLKPNHIYYTDDIWEAHCYCPGGKDMGIYNLEDGSIQRIYSKESLSKICPPIWVNASY